MARPGPSWSRLDRQLEREVRELVRHVAGLRDEADPNFQLCLNFAWSNFRCEAWRWAGPGRGRAGSAQPWCPQGRVAGYTRLRRPAVGRAVTRVCPVGVPRRTERRTQRSMRF